MVAKRAAARRTVEQRNLNLGETRFDESGVGAAVAFSHVIHCFLFDVRKDLVHPACTLVAVGGFGQVGGVEKLLDGAARGGKLLFGGLKHVAGQAELPQIVETLRSPRRLAGRLHRGEQKRDQDSNDGNHDQELHQGKAWLCIGSTSRSFQCSLNCRDVEPRKNRMTARNFNPPLP